MKFSLILLVNLFFVVGCTLQSEDLTVADYDEELLYYEVFGNTDKNHSTMVIYLPGDTGWNNGVDTRYLFPHANIVAIRHSVIAAAILRPGTRDNQGNRSPGYQSRNDDNKTSANNALVARTILYLKEKYDVENVIGVGHSGGGIMLGIIIGRYPGLIDSVILAGSVCHVAEYRIQRRRSLWPNSKSPHHFVESVPKNTMIRIVTGKNDNNTRPKYAKKCEALYKKHGLDVQATIVAGGTHNFRTLRSTVNKKLKDILE